MIGEDALLQIILDVEAKVDEHFLADDANIRDNGDDYLQRVGVDPDVLVREVHADADVELREVVTSNTALQAVGVIAAGHMLWFLIGFEAGRRP